MNTTDTKPTAGALRAATVIYAHTSHTMTRRVYHEDNGKRLSIQEISAIIDSETSAAELLAAWEDLLRKCEKAAGSSHMANTTSEAWRLSMIETARAAIANATTEPKP